MITFKHKISDVNGLHARNALVFSKMASGYPCRIRVGYGEKTADAKRVMALMGLGARRETELTVSVDGEEEAAAAAALRALAAEIL